MCLYLCREPVTLYLIFYVLSFFSKQITILFWISQFQRNERYTIDIDYIIFMEQTNYQNQILIIFNFLTKYFLEILSI